MFGTERRREWITKVDKPGSIRKETDNNPGYGVSVDQLQSYQTVLVPQFSGKITSAYIWATQVMADHFIDLTYVQLIRSTIQEDTLSVKSVFEIWDATFGVKIKIHHGDNGIFSEQPFSSAI